MRQPVSPKKLQASDAPAEAIASTAQRTQAGEREAPQPDMRDLIEVSSDWYWEQDASFRFTRVIGGPHAGSEFPSIDEAIGKRPWELGLEVLEDGGWPAHLEMLRARRSFRELIMHQQIDAGPRRWISVSGLPRFDESGQFQGYCGIGKDITRERERGQDLLLARAALDASPDMMTLVDKDTQRFVYANESTIRTSGYSADELRAMTPSAFLGLSPEEVTNWYEKTAAAGPEGLVVEVRGTARDGGRSIIEIHQRALQVAGRTYIVAISRDIGMRKRAEMAAQRISRMYSALSASNEAIIRASSPSDLFDRVCDAAVHGGGFIITNVVCPIGEGPDAGIVAISGASLERAKAIRFSFDETHPDGGGIVSIAYHSQITTVSQDFAKDDRTAPWHELGRQLGIASAAAVPLVRSGRVIGVVTFFSGERRAFDPDIVQLLDRMAANVVFALENFDHEEERKAAADRIEYLATHDSLTGLANRTMFNQVLNLSIESSRRHDRRFAVLFIDLDRFKIINDTLGHDSGDALLKEMSRRFKRSLRSSDLVARLGGDEFVVLAQEIRATEDAAGIARNILSATIRPVEIQGHECRVTASIGISIFPDSGADEQALMKNADIAMYMAKEQGKNNFQIYSTEMKSPSLERMALEMGLRRALERRELSLQYQSKVDLKSGAIKGVEALLRWNSPKLGAISPVQFIPVAEETGLIIPIGRWVLRTACEQNVAWIKAGLPPVGMAVNLSPRQFADPDLVAEVANILADTGMQAELLEVEITESMVMHDMDRAMLILNGIKRLGVRIAIDDFGTGYSSLAQLKRFPIDTLKVDRSFIRDIPNDAEDRAITEAIVALAKSLKLTVIAEGVENDEQQSFLTRLSCDEMQGFLFSRPLPPDAFAALLARHSAALPS